MDKIKEYFNSCVNYWMSTGVSKWVATCRVIWWDCVDVWNTEKSWNDDKVAFVNQYRKYKPYDPIPEEDRIQEGNA